MSGWSALAIATGIFLIGDAIWLGVVAKDLYRQHIGHLMADSVRWGAALAFYLLFLYGLFVFVIQPALAAQDPMSALLKGALFGLVCYATYDLTNLATLRDWPLSVTFIDLAWGAFLSGTAAGTAVYLVQR